MDWTLDEVEPGVESPIGFASLETAVTTIYDPERYEAVEIDGSWYILDHRHPMDVNYRCKTKEDAYVTARVFNLLREAGLEKQ